MMASTPLITVMSIDATNANILTPVLGLVSPAFNALAYSSAAFA